MRDLAPSPRTRRVAAARAASIPRSARSALALSALALGLAAGLSACDPYSPGQRAVGGGLLGAGAGAAIAGATGGNAGTGALIGGGVGAVGGAVTTPNR